MNFKGFMTDFQGDAGGGRPAAAAANNNINGLNLARQSSIYSLTFDELQNTMGGPGKDFGSMNMDELLKSIWTAEETQTMMVPTTIAGGAAATTTNAQDGGLHNSQGGMTMPLQRQGSLTLPRTLSQKTVDEVWRNLSSKDGGAAPSNLPQRQQTLGEMTLEEFLFRAGVVREDGPVGSKPSGNNTTGGFFGELARFSNTGGFGYQQPPQLNGNQGQTQNNQASNLALNANGVRSSNQQQQLPQQQQIFPKQQPVTYSTSQMALGPNTTQLGSPGMMGGGIMGIGDNNGIMNNNTSLVQSPVLQGGGAMGMVGLGNNRVAAAVSPVNQLSSDGIGKSNGTDTSSVSPMPYVFSNGFRGRKGGPVEKVVERRQRRMIKNRESAARSRARKQAYTMELEAEVAKLKEENQEMKKKQDEMMELQKNKDMEILNLQRGGKRRCLRRTQTGPW